MPERGRRRARAQRRSGGTKELERQPNGGEHRFELAAVFEFVTGRRAVGPGAR
jgi:hypothetical protein